MSSESKTPPRQVNLACTPILTIRGDGKEQPQIIVNQGTIIGETGATSYLASFLIPLGQAEPGQQTEVLEFSRVISLEDIQTLTLFENNDQLASFAGWINARYQEFISQKKASVKDVTAAGSEGAVGTVVGVPVDGAENTVVTPAKPAEKELPDNVANLAAARRKKENEKPSLPDPDDGVDPPPMTA